ncbi:hypothetical protein JRI60_37045 [Archangium violaceum]|uniref:hypothetical protein n=1 Tax=Archangium violaceum TaxID=83451 RepID=UPI00194F8C7F|nr:hypothetical protein [Archangium violaceum]QRN94686.1 hypothetical protein JRI60_37045 [Archangium violaceum]
MTLKKNLKKRVRARQEKTGESYTTARMHVLNQEQASRPKVSQESLREVTPLVDEVGLTGQAFLMPRFLESLARPALKRLRELLLATRDEPATQRMRAVLLNGEPDTMDFASLSREWVQTQAFLRNLRLGMRGPSRSGRLLSFELRADGMPVTIVVALMPSLKETPKLLLGAAEDFLHAVHTLSNPAVLSGSFFFPDVW